MMKSIESTLSEMTFLLHELGQDKSPIDWHKDPIDSIYGNQAEMD